MAKAPSKKLIAKITKKIDTKVSPSKPIGTTTYPRHTIEKCLRVPKAILDQNAGKPCTRSQLAGYLGVGLSGELQTEFSSAIKYGLLQSTGNNSLQPSELAKKILRPQAENDEIDGYRECILNAPQIKDAYLHYRGENLPDDKFLENTLVESFQLPREKVTEFKQIFLDNLKSANLLQTADDKFRVLDLGISAEQSGATIKKSVKNAKINASDTCFVMMPFASPMGTYYGLIYEPAIEKAGLTPVRADSDIFGTGKIIDQILEGIKAAKVLVAELTGRNPNVFYELGIAHAIKKPVVLVSATEQDVPFDVKHIRVIYYDKDDPFWGEKLIQKVAENIAYAIEHPDEATLPGLD